MIQTVIFQKLLQIVMVLILRVQQIQKYQKIKLTHILDETDLQQVLQEIDFVASSDSFGIDTYIRTLKLVENILCTEEQWP